MKWKKDKEKESCFNCKYFHSDYENCQGSGDDTNICHEWQPDQKYIEDNEDR